MRGSPCPSPDDPAIMDNFEAESTFETGELPDKPAEVAAEVNCSARGSSPNHENADVVSVSDVRSSDANKDLNGMGSQSDLSEVEVDVIAVNCNCNLKSQTGFEEYTEEEKSELFENCFEQDNEISYFLEKAKRQMLKKRKKKGAIAKENGRGGEEGGAIRIPPSPPAEQPIKTVDEDLKNGDANQSIVTEETVTVKISDVTMDTTAAITSIEEITIDDADDDDALKPEFVEALPPPPIEKERGASNDIKTDRNKRKKTTPPSSRGHRASKKARSSKDEGWEESEDSDGEGDAEEDEEEFEIGMLPPVYPKSLERSPLAALHHTNQMIILINGEIARDHMERSNLKPFNSSGLFEISDMLHSGRLDASIMRLNITDTQRRHHEEMVKMFEKHNQTLKEDHFERERKKQVLNNMSNKSKLLRSAQRLPNMQCIRCGKREYSDLVPRGVFQGFVCETCLKSYTASKLNQQRPSPSSQMIKFPPVPAAIPSTSTAPFKIPPIPPLHSSSSSSKLVHFTDTLKNLGTKVHAFTLDKKMVAPQTPKRPRGRPPKNIEIILLKSVPLLPLPTPILPKPVPLLTPILNGTSAASNRLQVPILNGTNATYNRLQIPFLNVDTTTSTNNRPGFQSGGGLSIFPVPSPSPSPPPSPQSQTNSYPVPKRPQLLTTPKKHDKQFLREMEILRQLELESSSPPSLKQARHLSSSSIPKEAKETPSSEIDGVRSTERGG